MDLRILETRALQWNGHVNGMTSQRKCCDGHWTIKEKEDRLLTKKRNVTNKAERKGRLGRYRGMETNSDNPL